MQLNNVWISKICDWNNAHPNHPPVMIRWEPQAVKQRVIKWVAGVPIPKWKYLPRWQVGVRLTFVPTGMTKMAYPIEGSGDVFIKLFTWMDQATKEFLQLDDRIFECLGEGDMTKRTYEEMIVEPEEEKEKAEIRDRATMSTGVASYYEGHDNPIVSMDPTVKAGAGWRWRTR